MKKSTMKFFDLHEYQSKMIFRKYGLNVQGGDLATSTEEAYNIAKRLKGDLIIKAQVHAGGRGKGKLTSGLQGGVKFCTTPEEVKNYAQQMINYNLITHQTPKEGLLVKSVLVLESVDIKKQIYLAFLLDRKNQSPVVVVSNEGGMDIEEVSSKNPDAIKVFPINLKTGLDNNLAKQVCTFLDFENETQRTKAMEQLQKLYNLFMKIDATQIEINPWALDTKGDIYLVDAKVNVDDSALFRQNEINDFRENPMSSEDLDKNEEEARNIGLNYIGLDGNIGCLVNGAGLAMSTMDIIKLKGGDPANFLDIGGGANADQVTTAFRILNSHPKVKAILVNIFGGIMRCDIVAQGIIQAVTKIGVTMPVVVRLTGTNAEQGLKMLNDFSNEQKGKFSFITAVDLDQAAEFAVKSINESNESNAKKVNRL